MVLEALSRLHTVGESLPEWERPSFRSPATQSSLEAFEQIAGVQLPGDFRQFLLLADGVVAMDIQNGYWIGGTEGLTRSVGRDDFPRSVQGIDAVPVATDGGGNAFLLAVTGDRVWRWDHETGQAKVVATSFTNFLHRVADDWDQFKAGNQEWHYLV